MPMQKRFARDLQTLPHVVETVSAFCREHGATGDSIFALSFAVEEIFTNMVKYNPDGPAEVSISLGKEQKDVRVILEDDQEHEFDPTDAPQPAFGEELSKRKPGGLGLYLVKKMVNDVSFERKGIRNIITLTHPLE